MDTIAWPAQSPDLNLIEALWMDMETEPGEIWGRISDIPVLQDVLSTIWEAIPAERLDSLIRSMPQRLQAVIDAEGEATRY